MATVPPQPSIELFGLVIHTPITMVTDIIVAIICFVAFAKLRNLPDQGNVHRLFKYYFLSMGLATFLGGVVGHGLMHYLPFYMKIPGWITSMFSIALLERAVIQYTRRLINPRIGRFFSWLNIIELLVFMILSLVTLNFQFVLIHAAYGMAIVVTGFTGFIYLKERSRGSAQILLAVLICSIGAFFFVFQIGIDKWFNHVDVSHVFMMAGSVLYYKGSKKMILSQQAAEATSANS
ncbi:MAG: hypothetical protein ABJG78_17825 [Cyclobacteriaceae bacterium]